MKRGGRRALLDEVYRDCVVELKKPREEMRNAVKKIYDSFSAEEISAEISRMVYPEDLEWSGEVEVVFQTIDNLHDSIEDKVGDWYFTGNYPTPGGFYTVNVAYINWFKGVAGRSYDLPL